MLVFGDVGHSPRMINHVRELVRRGVSVELMGFLQSDPPKDIFTSGDDSKGQAQVKIHPIPACEMPATRFTALRLFLMAIRLVLQSILVLFHCLTRIESPQLILVQSPPVLPTLVISVILKWRYRCRYVIDWHNIGYTLLAQKIAAPAVIASMKGIELFLTRFGDAHLVVSRSQQVWMQTNGGVTANVYYDRPSTHFGALQGAERKSARERFRRRLGWESQDDGIPLLVSSTSWTPDEDFDLFVGALEALDSALPRAIHVIVTGKGPLRQKYEEQILGLHLRRIHFCTTWLSYEEYCELLGAADYGLCLHVSSSGVDLPMKVVDMLGSGLPVIARKYAAIGELVEEGQNGFVFDSVSELTAIIVDLVTGKRRAPRPAKLEGCSEHWESRVMPLLRTGRR